MRILLIDRDENARKNTLNILSSEKIVTDSVRSCEEGREMAALYEYDMIILNLNASEDVVGFVRSLRSLGSRVPLFGISGGNPLELKLNCFYAGMDDILSYPFDKRELIARIYTIIRRFKGYPDSIVTAGDLKINLNTKIVTIKDQAIHLTSKEYALLELLALRKGSPVSKEQFLNHLYSGMDEPEMKIITVFLCHMRRKIEAFSEGKQYIQTVWGRGYTLKDG